MHKLLTPFNYISDIPLEIDRLVEEAGRTRGRKEKHGLLVKAQELADALQSHCSSNGNDKKLFNQIV